MTQAICDITTDEVNVDVVVEPQADTMVEVANRAGGMEQVFHDNTLIGNGNSIDLGVNTDLIATKEYVDEKVESIDTYTKDQIDGKLTAVDAQIDANADAIQKTREDYIQADSEIHQILNSHADELTTLRGNQASLGDQVSGIEEKIPESASGSNPLITKQQLLDEEMDIREDLNEGLSELQTQITAQAAEIATKQDQLTAGDNIVISGNVISATGAGGGTGFDVQVVQELPATGQKGIIYLLAKDGAAPDVYDEYVWIESTQTFELIGTTQVDLTDYVKKTDYATGTVAGVVRVGSYVGTTALNGFLCGNPRTLEEYKSTINQTVIAKGTLENIKDDYIKRGLTENALTFTDDEKAKARTLIGAGSQTDLNNKAADNKVVHLAGSENITGIKTFTLPDNIKFTASKTAGYTPSMTNATNGLTPATNVPWSRNGWHDHFAFGQSFTVFSKEVSTDGETWVADDRDVSYLFAQKEYGNTGETVLAPNAGEMGFRFVLQSANIAYSNIQWIEIGFAYTTAHTVRLLIESSPDGAEWTEVHNSTTGASATNKYLYVGNLSAANTYLRISIIKLDTTYLDIITRMLYVKGWTTRKGNQGRGIEFEKPYFWDNVPNIMPINSGGSNLGSVSRKWNTVYATKLNNGTNITIPNKGGTLARLEDIDAIGGDGTTGQVLTKTDDGMAWQDATGGGSTGGLESVAHDSSLEGAGTTASPLKVASTVIAQINDKADSTVVETLSSAVSENTTKLNTLRSDTDSLGNQVSSIEGKIPSSASATNQLATKSEIPTVPTNISAFNNDSGYITSSALTPYATTQALNDGLATKQPAGDYATNSALTSGLALKVAIAQGVENAGKILKIDDSGNVIVADESGGASLPILYHTWADHLLNGMSWLRADTFSWQSGDVYVAAYEHLSGDLASVPGTQYYAWLRYGSQSYYTTVSSPSSRDTIYYKNASGDMIRFDEVMEGGSQTIYSAGGDEFTRDSSKDETVPQKQTDTIGDISITYYLAEDGHKICLPDQESNIVALYEKIGAADYYILDTTNKRFKLPRKQKRTLMQAVKNNDGTWYNLYSDGWVEQGGQIIRGSITFAIPMADLNYTVSGAQIRSGSTNGTYYNAYKFVNMRETGIDLDNAQSENPLIAWSVSGYAAESAYVSAGMRLEYYYVGNFEQTAVEQTAGLNAELFNGKADVDLGNIPTNYDYVVESQEPTADNGYTWYRKYKSGWVEQGGKLSGRSITFPIQFALLPTLTTCTVNSDTNVVANNHISDIKTTGFDGFYQSMNAGWTGSARNMNGYWAAFGFAIQE